jgi:hypothetical protein
MNEQNKFVFFHFSEFCHNAVVSAKFGGQGHISACQMKDDVQMCSNTMYIVQ